MSYNELNRAYFKWMCQLICNDDDWDFDSHSLMLSELHHIDFEYTHPMDECREEDGINLRYRFAREQRIEARLIASALDIRPCSVLEMLVALAVRCEEQIMTNPEYGDRTGLWFWTMMDNLGLSSITNDRYDAGVVYYIVDRFMDREYDFDGMHGGLFHVPNPRRDLREVDIWYQMMWYLTSSIQE